jgi:hypothetical protein
VKPTFHGGFILQCAAKDRFRALWAKRKAQAQAAGKLAQASGIQLSLDEQFFYVKLPLLIVEFQAVQASLPSVLIRLCITLFALPSNKLSTVSTGF